jgi:hypothetical protein
MKSFSLSAVILSLAGFSAFAQLSNGGIPESLKFNIDANSAGSNMRYVLPDWNTFIQQKDKEEKNGLLQPYQFGMPVSTNISFPESGSITTLENGVSIWRAQIQIAGAPAIGLYYDKFHLPDGVQLFLSNNNSNQILGAYTSTNNFENGMFANEAVQGDIVNIELDIAPGINLNEIQLHVNTALVYFRSYEYLNKYKYTQNTLIPLGLDTVGLDGSSSVCMINALCPLGNNYEKQRKATVQMLSLVGMCTATLINNTGNTPANCKHYMLAATHCDHNNDTSGSFFSQMLVRFNFEKEQCQGGALATVHTIVGSNFVAKADYHEMNPPVINGDFLLMELKENIPSSWDAYMAGWNRATTVPATLTYPQKYISFNHPAADVKKVLSSNHIEPDGEAGGSLGPGTHWVISPIDSGGAAPGTSGSGLFDGSGRLIGMASVGGNFDDNCATNANGGTALFGKLVEYAKFSLAWDYSVDGNYTFRKLKPWLDPANTGAVTIDAIKADCSDANNATKIGNAPMELDNNINIYPNPTSTGIVTIRTNFVNPTSLNMELFNTAGARLQSLYLKNIDNGAYLLDLSHYANGMYLIKFNDGANTVSKKIMVAK